ncbi:Methylosome subunit pICln [Halotydeus destructor]|nr:Methylosome subunit pICln [Halotydeus destructor]
MLVSLAGGIVKPEDEDVSHCEAETLAYFRSQLLGSGNLYIAKSRLYWLAGDSGQGFSLEYPSISLHAVSRDRTSFEHECLYLMLDSTIEGVDKDLLDKVSGKWSGGAELIRQRSVNI